MDAVKLYGQLGKKLQVERKRLMSKRAALDERIQVIDAALGAQDAVSVSKQPTVVVSAGGKKQQKVKKAGGKGKLTLKAAVMQALANGPLDRNGLLKEVQRLGYVFATKDPLNSLGVILYGKGTPIKNNKGTFSLPNGKPAEAQAAGEKPTSPSVTKPTTSSATKAKRSFSADARARMAAAQKARWAKKAA